MYFVIYSMPKSKKFGKKTTRAKGRETEAHHYSCRRCPCTTHKVVSTT